MILPKKLKSGPGLLPFEPVLIPKEQVRVIIQNEVHYIDW
jgi:hypothetical protein